MLRSSNFIFLSLLLALSSCSNSGFKVSKTSFVGKRQIAYDESSNEENKVDPNYLQELTNYANENGQHLEFPPGLNYTDKSLMWHMSEGSEIYPTLWMMNLESMKSKIEGTMFLDRMDEKFGLIKDYLYKDKNYVYPMKWIGLTAAWSEEDPENQDILLKKGESFSDLPKIHKLKSENPSIAMTGVNCTFCHTGNVTVKDGDKSFHQIIEGAPATIDARGFFKDLVGSTFATMLDPEALGRFFEKFEVKNAKEEAATFSNDFRVALGAQKTFKTELVSFLEKVPGLGEKVTSKKEKEVASILYQKRDVIEGFLIRLLKITYGIDKVPTELAARMKYFATFGSPDPFIEESPTGYGRTDAFGRISNAVARGKNPIGLTSAVSMPYMYAIKYKAMFHYNANTNSVIARNIGQSFGLGAILTTPKAQGIEKFASTSNLNNLITMEKILYKVKVPEFQALFPEVKIDKVSAVKGCNVYMNKCMTCHEAGKDRVGPARALINYKVLPVERMGTDETYIWNQATPIEGRPFRKGLFDFTDGAKSWYFQKNNISPEEVNHWANASLRGVEIFRDTINGDDRYADDQNMNYITIAKGRGYVAKHLAGIWATAPYLHNGSVPNIYEMLLPSNKRSPVFVVGNTEFDNEKMGFKSGFENHPDAKNSNSKSICDGDLTNCVDVSYKGSSNVGHEPAIYGGELKNSDKRDLIEFLKVLRPEVEYSWTSTPIYKVVDSKCVSR